MSRMPDIKHVLIMHRKLVERTGGLYGVRDIGLVESALMRADAQYGGVEAYPGVIEKTAAVCCGLIRNHGFVDGNKRIGIAIMLLMLKMNDIAITYTQRELIELGLKTADGSLDVEQVTEWINSHRK